MELTLGKGSRQELQPAHQDSCSQNPPGLSLSGTTQVGREQVPSGVCGNAGSPAGGQVGTELRGLRNKQGFPLLLPPLMVENPQVALRFVTVLYVSL